MTSFLFSEDNFLDSNSKFRYVPWELIEEGAEVNLRNQSIEDPFFSFPKTKYESPTIVDVRGNPCFIPNNIDSVSFISEISRIENEETREVIKKLYNKGWLVLGNDYLVVNIVEDKVYYGYITWMTDITPYLSDEKFLVFSYNREHGFFETFFRKLLLE
jgi:hypothetical protein